VIIDGQSYLLLIRDEGGSPEMQVGFENLDISFSNKIHILPVLSD
jgi:hypothetical protein